jgi:hypothetical protein
MTRLTRIIRLARTTAAAATAAHAATIAAAALLAAPLAPAAVAVAAPAPGFTTTVSAAEKPEGPWKDHPTRLVSTLPGYKQTTDAKRTLHGGDPARARQKATGFFHPQKIDGRWWLIDPKGHPALHIAIVNIAIPQSSPTAQNAFAKKYATKQNWADATMTLLRANGFNGAGAWSDHASLKQAVTPPVYTIIWDFMSTYGKKRGGIYQTPGRTGYPKNAIFVFDPEFETFCDTYAKKLAAHKNDPWLLGHFSDNELPFFRDTLKNFLSLPETDPGHRAAAAWLARRRNIETPPSATPAAASAAAAPPAAAPAPLSATAAAVLAASLAATPITPDEGDAFIGYVADRYYAITTAAIRKHDPNHLCLGSRLDNGYTLKTRSVFEAAGRHLDVIAINYYFTWTPDAALLRNWERWSARPFLITEWYAKGMDTGYPNKSGAGWTVKTQDDRGRFYQNFVLGLLESRACVGWHWFKYLDNDPADTTADPSNIDSNKGLVNLRLDPYPALLRHMKELNKQVYSIINYMDAEKFTTENTENTEFQTGK